MSIENNAKLFSFLNYLQEEFQNFPKTRVRIRQLATTQKSPDLEQDYDPETNDLHRTQGVLVTANGREYFFPIHLANVRQRPELDKNIQEIKDFLEGS
jgi:hypothetical protein